MNDRLSLPSRYRRMVEKLLSQHVPDAEVWAYGSRVNGQSHKASDLDLVVRDPSAQPLGVEFLDLVEAFQESDIPILVQVHDWARLPESFHREIKRNYVTVQKAANPMPSDGWREVTLGDVADLVMGQSPPGSTYNDVGDGLPFFQGVKDFNYRHPTPRVFCSAPTRIAYTGDILISVRAPIGRVNVADRECATGRGLAIVRPHSPSDARYIEFALRHLESNWGALETSGSVFGNATRQDLESLALLWPTENSNRSAIGHILGTLDDKIELNRLMNETLEAMAKALFKSWFVDFDPVRANIEARDADMPPDLAVLFPDRVVHSEFGEIPEGWTVKELGDVIELNPREPIKRGAVAPYLDMASLPTSGPTPSTPTLREFKSGARFRNGDTLLARITPCLENGKTAFVQSLATGTVGWGSTEFIVLRAVPPVPPEYTYLLARDATFREHAIQRMTGTSGRQRVQVDALAHYPLPIPPTETWDIFRAMVSPLFAQIKVNRQESLALAAQRNALLPALMMREVWVDTLSDRLPEYLD